MILLQLGSDTDTSAKQSADPSNLKSF